MQLFYCKDIMSEGFYTLDAEESRHAVRVMRLREGDELHVTDGRGHLYRCQIIQTDGGNCTVECVSQLPNADGKQPILHLAVAPTKNPARMEWLVEKAVEMGVGEITMLQCDHSERTFLKTERLEKLAISAMKQSLHTILPTINPPIRLKDWLNNRQLTASCSLKCIAHCEEDQPRKSLGSVFEAGRDAVVLIGPEGDFSREEIDLALGCDFQPVSFGSSRLRTETAALYAVAAFNYVNNR